MERYVRVGNDDGVVPVANQVLAGAKTQVLPASEMVWDSVRVHHDHTQAQVAHEHVIRARTGNIIGSWRGRDMRHSIPTNDLIAWALPQRVAMGEMRGHSAFGDADAMAIVADDDLDDRPHGTAGVALQERGVGSERGLVIKQ